MVFEEAGPAEIVRLSKKDEHYLTQLRTEVTVLLQKFKGIRWWISWHKELQLVTDALYFGFTTLLGNQTLGEEYVNVIQVDNSKIRIPQTWKRILMIFLHVGGPYAIERVAQLVRQTLATHPQFSSRHPRLYTFAENILPKLGQIIAILQRCHLLLFYFNVRYYSFAKRLTGIRYSYPRFMFTQNTCSSNGVKYVILRFDQVLIRPWLEDGLSRWGYWVLGLLSFSQLLLSTTIYLLSYWSRTESKFNLPLTSTPSPPSTMYGSSSCPLCLSIPSSPTATPCGHIFCWRCIMQWLDMKQQCPMCSERFDPSRLIYLRN